MTGPDGLLGLVSSLLRLVLFALVVGVVVAAMFPGGPLDAGGLDGPPSDSAIAGTVTQSEGGVVTATDTPSERPRGRSPWGKEVLVVAVRNQADPSRNVTGAVADALEYWEANVGYGAYAAEFRLRPDATNPDVVVWYNDTIECTAHRVAIGCAPLLDASSEIDPPVDVQLQYDPDDNRRQVRNTAIHEFGHLLGITHCQEPYWVMASSCAEPVPAAADAEGRDLAWRDGTVTVYVDDANVSEAELEETRSQIGLALAYFEEANPEEFPAEVTVVPVEDRFAADVSVEFLDRSACSDDAVVCYSREGRDFDNDGRMEYYTAGTVRVSPDTDVEARGWYVGWALAHQLSPGNIPPVFEDASHRERRSRWWE